MRKLSLFGCSSVVALTFAALQSPAMAQDGADEVSDVVVVTGIRGSLLSSADVKREANGVVDAITSEDIGKFPDTNLAESLQRITGVSIDRRNGEGNQISVRGFGPSFNLVTLNGRQMPGASSPKQENASSANVPRSFNFSEIAAESVSAVEVYKTARPELPSGGIGATVNLRTARPFDFNDIQATLKANALIDTSNEQGSDVTPEISGLYSQTFMEDRVGILLNGSYSARDSRENIIATDGWIRGNVADASATGIDATAIDPAANPSGAIWVPRNLLWDFSDHERTRINGQAVLQFAPTDRLTLTADYTYSRYRDDISRNQTAVWFQQDSITGVTDSNGTVINPTVTGRLPGTIDGDDAGFGAFDFNGYFDQVETENQSIGVNLEWVASDNLTFTFDFHDSESHAQPDGQSSDFLVILAGPLGLSYSADFFGTEVPVFSFDDTLTPNGTFDPLGLRPNIDLGRGNENLNEITQYQLHAEWDNLSGGAIQSIRAGVDYIQYSVDTGFLFDLNVQGTPACGQTCADLVTLTSRGDLGDPFAGGDSLAPSTFVFDSLEVFAANQTAFPSVFSSRSVDFNNIEEDTFSAYLQFDMEDDFNGMPFRAVAGFRYEHTDVTSNSEFSQPIGLSWGSPTELRPVFAAEETVQTAESSYDFFLPSVDMSLEPIEDVLIRASYGRSLSRNDLLQLRSTLAISDSRPGCNQGGSCTANQGNPALLPYVSDNFDFAIEKYFTNNRFFGDGSYVAVNYFKKFVDNYVVFNTEPGEIIGGLGFPLTDPNPTNDPSFTVGGVGGPDDQVIIWDITSPENGEAAEVGGWEFAAQLLFGETGFGTQLNYTLVNGDIDFDTSNVDSQVALTGLSDTANLVAFYENDFMQIRLAWNWREEFLLSTEQLRQPTEPVFVDEYWQLDLSADYNVRDNISVFFEGINLTNETQTAHGRFDNQFIYAIETGPRLGFGVRGSL